MHDPLSAGRRLALRTLAWQAGSTALLALAFLASGVPHAAAVLVGGGAMLLGGAIAARLMVGGGIQPANVVMVRWFAGVVSKWLLVVVMLLLGLAVWRLPPLPLLLGIVVALIAQMLATIRR
ncbi:hypothetical protein [Lysobacter sp. D1-1-M9]|uniref:hypothetical protein n=1 Tax=Novilysobacter longmucuonensis TaxID=3098603 RepID=UPI002FC75FD8